MTRSITFQRITRSLAMRALAFGLAMAIAVTAHADSLGTALLGTSDSWQRLCVMTNVGTTPVAVASARFLNMNNVEVTTASNCGVLAPGDSCGFSVWGPVSVDWTRAVVELTGKNVAKEIRGQCVVWDENNRVVATQELR
jgi:hypothetical protein